MSKVIEIVILALMGLAFLALMVGGLMLERWIRCGCWEVPFA